MHSVLDSEVTFLEQERKFAFWNTVAKLSLVALFFGIVIIGLVNFDLSELQAFINWNRYLSFGISLLFFYRVLHLSLLYP